jgi:hypothetical protein
MFWWECEEGWVVLMEECEDPMFGCVALMLGCVLPMLGWEFERLGCVLVILGWALGRLRWVPLPVGRGGLVKVLRWTERG